MESEEAGAKPRNVRSNRVNIRGILTHRPAHQRTQMPSHADRLYENRCISESLGKFRLQTCQEPMPAPVHLGHVTYDHHPRPKPVS